MKTTVAFGRCVQRPYRLPVLPLLLPLVLLLVLLLPLLLSSCATSPAPSPEAPPADTTTVVPPPPPPDDDDADILALDESNYYQNYKAGAGGVSPTPYRDATFLPGGHLRIPGTVRLAYFDEGGEGISYHDSDGTHTGGFRTQHAVDTKRIPFGTGDGDRPSGNVGGTGTASTVTVEQGMPYVGWTATGEWLCYTVNILESGRYTVDCFYSSNGPNSRVGFSIDGIDGSGAFALPSTSYYHQWHECRLTDGLELERGRRVLRFNVLAADGANLGYLTFTRIMNDE
jgi:hypothetical protein